MEFKFATAVPHPEVIPEDSPPLTPRFRNTKYYKQYLHSSKEIQRAYGLKLGLDGPALDEFWYACYEVELECEVDLDTGDVRIWGVNGQPLENPVMA